MYIHKAATHQYIDGRKRERKGRREERWRRVYKEEVEASVCKQQSLQSNGVLQSSNDEVHQKATLVSRRARRKGNV
jgi:hypothetical protein